MTAGTGEIYVGSEHGLSAIMLGSGGKPRFAGCLGDLAGCATTKPPTALEAPTGVLSGKNLYEASASGNDLSQLVIP